MLCHNCGGENPEDYKFCIHCGTPRQAAAPQEESLKAAGESPAAPPRPEKSGHGLLKQKWFIAGLIGVVLLCCLVVTISLFNSIQVSVGWNRCRCGSKPKASGALRSTVPYKALIRCNTATVGMSSVDPLMIWKPPDR